MWSSICHQSSRPLIVWHPGAGTKAATAQGPAGFPFPANARGMTATDAMLRVPGHPRVFAIGDTAAALATAPNSPQDGFAPTAQVRPPHPPLAAAVI